MNGNGLRIACITKSSKGSKLDGKETSLDPASHGLVRYSTYQALPDKLRNSHSQSLAGFGLSTSQKKKERLEYLQEFGISNCYL
jgi:hypothetical protein